MGDKPGRGQLLDKVIVDKENPQFAVPGSGRVNRGRREHDILVHKRGSIAGGEQEETGAMQQRQMELHLKY